MSKRGVTLIATAVAVLCAVQLGRAQAPDDLGTLRKEVETLKEGQTAIQKELQEIKNLLMRGAPPAPSPSPGSAAESGPLISIADAPFKGEAGAKLTIVEFSDYQCPFCAAYARDAFPQIERDFIKTGKVKYVLRNLPLESIHPFAFKAAEAALCAGEQDKYWAMHDRLFANQNALGRKELAEYAQALGIDGSTFESCLDSGKYIAHIRKDIADAQKAGVSGTPTFFLGATDTNGATIKWVRKLIGAANYATFKQAIETLLASPN